MEPVDTDLDPDPEHWIRLWLPRQFKKKNAVQGYNLTMMPAANKKMVLFEFTMISVANTGSLTTVSVQDISKLSDALFSAK